MQVATVKASTSFRRSSGEMYRRVGDAVSVVRKILEGGRRWKLTWQAESCMCPR